MKNYFLICFMLITSLICAQESSTDLNARLDVTGELSVRNSGLWIKPSIRPEIKGDVYLFVGWNNVASIITGTGEKYKLKNINFDTNQNMFATKAATDSVFVFSRESIKQVMVNNKMFKRYSKDFDYDYYGISPSPSPPRPHEKEWIFDSKYRKNNGKCVIILYKKQKILLFSTS